MSSNLEINYRTVYVMRLALYESYVGDSENEHDVS